MHPDLWGKGARANPEPPSSSPTKPFASDPRAIYPGCGQGPSTPYSSLSCFCPPIVPQLGRAAGRALPPLIHLSLPRQGSGHARLRAQEVPGVPRGAGRLWPGLGCSRQPCCSTSLGTSRGAYVDTLSPKSMTSGLLLSCGAGGSASKRCLRFPARKCWEPRKGGLWFSPQKKEMVAQEYHPPPGDPPVCLAVGLCQGAKNKKINKKKAVWEEQPSIPQLLHGTRVAPR